MNITKDKKLHYMCGLGLSLIFGYNNPIIGVIVGMAAGVLKEVYDKFDYGKFDIMDMVYTCTGSLIGGIICYCYLMI